MTTKSGISEETPIDLLKSILANLREPKQLNNHPWSVSTDGSGEYLVEMTTAVFRKMTPHAPPHTGKRMDTRWGTFGILAAQYFAPLLLGEPFPSSLREAWNSMDRSILFFVYGRFDRLSEDEISKYRFAGNEIEPAPNSTLSDWHRKGLEQLAKMTELEHERLKAKPKSASSQLKIMKRMSLVLGILILMLGIFLGWKGWELAQHAKSIEQKLTALEVYLNPKPKLEQIPEIAVKVHDLRIEIDALQTEAEPYLWMTHYLAWVPKYGGTISQSHELISLAENLASTADEGLTAISPTIKTTLNNKQPLEVMDLVLQLQTISPQLLNAQVSLAQAQKIRTQINVDSLTPKIRNMIIKRIDPLFASIAGTFPMDDALTVVRIAPTLLGSGKAGPQSYLIFMQNEDELRPTGGFLTAVGSAVVKDGKLLSMKIESSDLVDDPSKPFPIPPWQFKKFMNIEMFLFRDSNWFTDFPTTVSWAEYFYSYSRSTSSDGVIALDMHVIVQLLKTLGPVRVNSVSFPITSDNVQDYLRSAETAPPIGVKKGEWDRKKFLGELAQPLLEKILGARGETWTKLAPILLELLDEKHILVQFDNQDATTFLEHRNWDGAVRIPQNSDFLMAVDTNMGYNKSNAMMESSFEYNVNLSTPANPIGDLIVTQMNLSKVDIPCEPQATSRFLLPPRVPGEIREPFYNMDECHWGYLRIYTPADTKLLQSNPQEIPAESTWLGEAIPAHTDDLGDEDIPGVHVFGSMVITPTHQSTQTEYEYSLPAETLRFDDTNKVWVYQLKVQKQPGMLAQPLKLTLHLPEGAKIKSTSIPLSEDAGTWTTQLNLRYDLLIKVTFGS